MYYSVQDLRRHRVAAARPRHPRLFYSRVVADKAVLQIQTSDEWVSVHQQTRETSESTMHTRNSRSRDSVLTTGSGVLGKMPSFVSDHWTVRTGCPL